MKHPHCRRCCGLHRLQWAKYDVICCSAVRSLKCMAQDVERESRDKGREGEVSSLAELSHTLSSLSLTHALVSVLCQCALYPQLIVSRLSFQGLFSSSSLLLLFQSERFSSRRSARFTFVFICPMFTASRAETRVSLQNRRPSVDVFDTDAPSPKVSAGRKKEAKKERKKRYNVSSLDSRSLFLNPTHTHTHTHTHTPTRALGPGASFFDAPVRYD